FSEAVARLLGLRLDAFAGAGYMLEVRVPWNSTTLWFVPDDVAAEALVAEGVSRGRIWTSGELLDLLSIPTIGSAGVQTIARTKLAVDGDVRTVRSRGTGWRQR